jgi:hypothetical protein
VWPINWAGTEYVRCATRMVLQRRTTGKYVV